MGGVTQQEAPSIAQALDHTLVHLKSGNPAEIVQTHVSTGPHIEQSAQLGSSRKLALRISIVAIDENNQAIIRQRPEQYEPSRPYNETAAFGRAGKANFDVG